MVSKKSAWEEAKKYGIDVNHLEDNLRKSYTQRFREHQNASNFVDILREAGKMCYEKLRKHN
jgi:hypothetical protein